MMDKKIATKESSMSADPKWSVMMPTFNPRKNYFIQSIESILQQHTSDMEVIVVDNNSQEVDVQELVNLYGQGRVVYKRNAQNIGLVPNWNKCIELARGNYIHILHDDDIVSNGFYVKAENYLSEKV